MAAVSNTELSDMKADIYTCCLEIHTNGGTAGITTFVFTPQPG